MKLTESDANKLVEPETEEIQGIEAEGGAIKQRTIRARKYRFNIESLGFDLQQFWENPMQPYSDKVFDNSLVQSK